MGRNRKNGSDVRLVPAMWAAVICLLLGSSAIGYVYQKNQIIELGRQIQKSEQRLTVLRDNNAKLRKQLLTLQSGVYLEKRVKELNLGLVQPVQSQILTLVEMPPTAPLRNEPLVAGREGGRIAALK
jgi:cell division protein FtsB